MTCLTNAETLSNGVLDVVCDGRLPNSMPQIRTFRHNAMVDMYTTAGGLKSHSAMNIILDVFLADVASNEIFPETLI